MADYTGTTGNDTYTGTSDADTIHDGNGGNDTLSGEDGDDQITVTGGSDTANGGSGNDTLIINWADLTIAAYNSSGPNINGTIGGFDGQFYGNDGRSVTYSSVEHFTITTGSGNDNITTASGNDIVNTGSGDDSVDVGSGNDTANGGDGTDQISANLGGDSGGIQWNLATNSYAGSIGSFTNFEFFGTVTTGSGNDTLVSGAGARNEAITTGNGNDSVTVFGGADSVDLGAGDDVLIINWSDLSSAAYNSGGPTANGTDGGWDGQFYGNDGRSASYTSANHFHITTGSGNDTITTMGGNDIVNTGNGDDQVDVGSGNDTADGGDGADRISANLSSASAGIRWNLQTNVFSGDPGNFTNFEFFGTVSTGSGNDEIVSGSGARNEAINTGAGDDQITVFGGSDTANLGAGVDTIIIDWSDLTIAAYNSGGPTANGPDGGFDGQFYGNDGRSVTYTSADHFHITTGSGNDTITTMSGDDIVHAGAGDDIVDVGLAAYSYGNGVDEADGGDGNDRISTNLIAATTAIFWNLQTNSYSGPGSFTNFESFGEVITGSGDDVIVTGSGNANEIIRTRDGNDSITVFGGSDTAHGGNGNDELIINWGNLTVAAYNNGGPSFSGAEGEWNGSFYGNDGRSVNYSSIGRFQITTGSAGDNITTATGADWISTQGGDDYVVAGSGADTIISGSGNDNYDGGHGRDTLDFSGASAGVTVNLATGTASDGDGGSDTIASIERLIGSNHNDSLTGGLASEYFLGGGGADTMAGGNGGDFYAEVDAGDTIVEAAGGGVDTVQASTSFYTLGANVEILIANHVNFTGIGNTLNNTIIGGIGSDVLDGGQGDDLVMGGGGGDSVMGGDGDDIVLGGQLSANLLSNGSFEFISPGVDARTWILDAPNDYNGVTYRLDSATVSGWVVSGGNPELNTYNSNMGFATSHGDAALDMTSNIGENLTIYQDIAGIADAEPLVLSFDIALPTGGPVNANPDAVLQVYWNGNLVRTITPTTTEMTHYTILLQGVSNGSGAGGANRLEFREVGSSADARGTILDNVQLGRYEHDGAADNLLGGAGFDVLIGGANFDSLDGGLDADVMRGALGNDTYYVDDLGDFIIEYDGEGDDLVNTTLNSYALGLFLERLSFTGSGDFTGTGNGLNNIITGAAGNDSLNGGNGDDWLIGAGGNDALTGGAGADTMTGGAGNDLYIADEFDTITELAGEGTDTVATGAAAFTLADNLENLSFFGVGDFTGTGNALANVMTGVLEHDTLNGMDGDDTLNGLDGDDTLNGGAGADTLNGGQGNDVYIVDSAGDTVVEAFAEGIDRVETTLTNYSLGANVEDLTFTGTGSFTGVGNASSNAIIGGASADTLSGMDGNDYIEGAAGNDYIDGGTGDDIMLGGRGNDDYFVDSAGDVVTELGSEGTDTVYTSLNSYTIGANVENVTFNGSGNFVGTGNGVANIMIGGAGNDNLNADAGADSLYGGDGNDRLNGGSGADLMVGGTGNDTYNVNNVGDVVQELAGQGLDTVSSTIDYTLGAEIENLVLTSAALLGTGNALDNMITGNGQANTLTGLDGNDTIDGGAGVDTLVGGKGNDTFYVNVSGDVITERANEGTDLVMSSASSYQLRSTVENITLLVGGGDATGNAGANIMTGNEGNNRLSGNGGADMLYGMGGNDRMIGGTGDLDTLYGGKGDDFYEINDTLDVVVEEAGEGRDTVRSNLATYTLGANVEDLALYTNAIEGIGNGLNNLINGNALGNILDGAAGDDVIYGDAGNDAIRGGAGQDQLYGQTGSDRFVFADGDFSGVTAGTADRIADFNKAQGDIIDLTGVDAIVGGTDDAFSFIGTAAFSGNAGELRFVTSATHTTIMGDVDGDGVEDFWIRLNGVINLDAGDFDM